jgi:hypothetical protein
MTEPKEKEKNEERAFQLELAKIQQGMDVSGSIIGVIASVFVAIITTSLTLIAALPSTVIGITGAIIAYEFAVAVFTLLVSWWIIVTFRNRRIKKVREYFHIPDVP